MGGRGGEANQGAWEPKASCAPPGAGGGATTHAGPLQDQPSTCPLPQAVERRGPSRKDSASLWTNLAGRG